MTWISTAEILPTEIRSTGELFVCVDMINHIIAIFLIIDNISNLRLSSSLEGHSAANGELFVCMRS